MMLRYFKKYIFRFCFRVKNYFFTSKTKEKNTVMSELEVDTLLDECEKDKSTTIEDFFSKQVKSNKKDKY
jgi:hypothetical protein